MNSLILNDIHLEPYTDYEIELKEKNWKKSLLRKIKVIGDNKKEFEVEVPLDISIEEFKKILLNKENKPFFLEFDLDN